MEFKQNETPGYYLTIEVPAVSCVIDCGFTLDEKYNARLYDLAVTDDKKVWMGGHETEPFRHPQTPTSYCHHNMHWYLYLSAQQTGGV